MKTALLMLEDGNQFYGQSIGSNGESLGEIVFNTSMTGYQEIITDPSYSKQIVILTHPNIGNVGINDADNESNCIQVEGLVIRNLTKIPSNFRCTLSLSDFLKQQNVVGISDIDTRKLTRIIRETGTQNACIVADDSRYFQLSMYKLKAQKLLQSKQQLYRSYSVGTIYKYIWDQGSCWNKLSQPFITNLKKFFYHVVVYDFGIKYNIMRLLVDYGCILTIVPSNTTVQEVMDMNPDGIFLSNGPGDPTKYVDAIDIIKMLLNKTNVPIFGICLGYQLLALAFGAKIIKMKFGHHGSNHPVKDIENDRVVITAQNHNFMVDINTLPHFVKVTHISLFDKTLQGIRCLDRPIFGFQGHPEASPGPHDAVLIFNNFIKSIRQYHYNYKHIL